MNEKLILTLLDKFNAASIAELDLNDGTTRLVLRKEAAFKSAPAAGQAGTAPFTTVPAADAAAAHDPAGNVRLGLPVSSGGNDTITSPIVATFYGAPGPDSPPFVRPGSRVKAGDSLCILEAMKMMNHLEAEFDCEIISVLASNGDLVEYGQALFEVKRL
ncbi:MAG: acetyl-CoA carboxylase biotin carboxyl carrier protein [Treponema sp.]|jgi:acetyl-CoA carboxylase biotin carboxyl carrier protein|nr:acetyl-CoA carboxylase biotin carboxyl carrier protein [Treponema sp.]